MNLQQFKDIGFLEEIARVFDEEENTRVLLENINFPAEHIPNYQGKTSISFWREICREIDKGRTSGGFEALVQNASKQYPYNELFDTRKTQFSSADRINKEKESFPKINKQTGINLIISGYQPNISELFYKIKSFSRLCEIPGPVELSFATSTTLTLFLTNSTNQQALCLREMIINEYNQDNPPKVILGDFGFRDYLFDQLFIEGPDQGRFLFRNIPASTRLLKIVEALISQYNDDFWPQEENASPRAAVADKIQNDNSSDRLDSEKNLHDNKVRDGDTIQISPESVAGSISPIFRDEALSRVKSQVLSYAKCFSETFLVRANAVQFPTEYLFTFFGQGFAPPLNKNETPRIINKHEVFVILSSTFPMNAPFVLWQSPVYHPNIHPENNQLCLGELSEGYRPGLDFRHICQLLVDIAFYKNYNLDNPFNIQAAEWAKSKTGQNQIVSIGGHVYKNNSIPISCNTQIRSKFRVKRFD